MTHNYHARSTLQDKDIPILNMKKLEQLSGPLTWQGAAEAAAETEQPLQDDKLGWHLQAETLQKRKLKRNQGDMAKMLRDYFNLTSECLCFHPFVFNPFSLHGKK